MNKRQVIPYVLLFSVFLVWMYLKPQEIKVPLPKHHPSFIAHKINNVHFDESGLITYKMFAKKSTSFIDKDITHFENIKVVIYVKNKKNSNITTWQITSKKGMLSEKNRLQCK